MIDLVPYVEINGSRTVSDEKLKEVFYQIKQEGTLSVVFSDGRVNSEDDFISLMKAPTNCAVFALVDQRLSGFAWINSCNDNHAFAHFCFFKEAWGVKAMEVGKAMLDYWFKFPGPDGPLFDVIIGMIPKFNEKAQAFIERLGFQRVGEIPKIARRGKDRVPSVVSYYLRK